MHPAGDTGARTDPGTITRLLADLERGDSSALETLFPIVYEELRELAHRQRGNWNGDTTMGTTALVHEAYLKFAGGGQLSAHSRVHFLRVASRAMRQIISNYARDRRAAKRGGEFHQITLDRVADGFIPVSLTDEQSTRLADLDEALQRLDAMDPRLSAIVECRFFGGLTIDETASALKISAATVKRDWAVARAWLYRELTEGPVT